MMFAAATSCSAHHGVLQQHRTAAAGLLSAAAAHWVPAANMEYGWHLATHYCTVAQRNEGLAQQTTRLTARAHARPISML